MKEIGAKAVLAKRRGKFITNIRAINSICPGKTNAKHKLIDVTKRTNKISVVNTISQYIHAFSNPGLLFEKAQEEKLAIISLTITEGGYNINPNTGKFNMDNPLIQRDLQNHKNPQSIFGYLSECLF